MPVIPALLRTGPPLCPASVLCPSRFPPLGGLPLVGRVAEHAHLNGRIGNGTTGSPVPCQRLRRAHATYTPDTARPARRPPPGSGHATSGAPSSRGYLTTPVSMPSFYSFDASAVVHTRSSSRRIPDPLTAGLRPQRSPPRLLTDAACGGLSAPPARRTRRADLHHRHSTSRSGDRLHRHHSTFRTHSDRIDDLDSRFDIYGPPPARRTRASSIGSFSSSNSHAPACSRVSEVEFYSARTAFAPRPPRRGRPPPGITDRSATKSRTTGPPRTINGLTIRRKISGYGSTPISHR